MADEKKSSMIYSGMAAPDDSTPDQDENFNRTMRGDVNPAPGVIGLIRNFIGQYTLFNRNDDNDDGDVTFYVRRDLYVALETENACLTEQLDAAMYGIVAIKPLEWREVFPGTFQASSLMGRWGYWNGAYSSPENYGLIVSENPKADAEMEYARCILSAIQPDPDALWARDEQMRKEGADALRAKYLKDDVTRPAIDILEDIAPDTLQRMWMEENDE